MWRDGGVAMLLALAVLVTIGVQSIAAERKSVNVTMPRWVENGTEETVIIDCEYDYSLEEEHFVVKWFLNDNRQAVYQWIPDENSRIFSDQFLKHADWDYHRKPYDKYTKYPQIVLKKPTIVYSGTYQCTVDSSTGHGTAEGEMGIFARAKDITVSYQTHGNEVNITCEVKGVFPEPEVQLFVISEDSDVPKEIEDESLLENGDIDDGYNKTAYAVISTYMLNNSKDSIFRCVVSILGTSYQEEEEAIYHPLTELVTLESFQERDASSSINLPAFSVLLILAIFVL